MIANATSRLRQTLDEYGVANTILFGLQRVLWKLDRGIVIERQYIVAQAVPPTAEGAGRRGASIDIRAIGPDDPALTAFTRIATEIADRFEQSATCLGAFRQGELLGWLWFVSDSFTDFTHPVRFNLCPPGATSWDFDVYVKPEARLSAAFSRLWAAAFDAMRERGIRQTLSAISAYNPASLRAHRRLGCTVLGSIVVIRIGRFQAVCSRRFKPILQWSVQKQFQASLAVTAPDDCSIASD